jgi:hypothetical protein
LALYTNHLHYRFAPFTYDAWTSPETLAIVSGIAGVDLVPSSDYEIAHINFSVKSEEETKAELQSIEKQKNFFAADEGIAGCPWEDDKPIVGWHTDSYPFVCVLMLSDCTNMVGGETALRTGDGGIVKVRGPEMVSPWPLKKVLSVNQHRVALSSFKGVTLPIKLYARSVLKSASLQ